MKKVIFLMVLIACCSIAIAQVPQGFSYQAIVRSTDGEVLQDKTLKVIIAIKTALIGGTVIREEYHNVTSNQFGMVSFTVGSGTYVSGPATSFDLIDWKAQPLYLKTTIEYPVGTVTEMGTTQILSVPYSLVAKDVEGPIKRLGIRGSESSLDSALFEVKNKIGQTVFAVYPEGVRVYVADGAKGKKGGFAVGSFGEGKAESQKYFVVSKDSIRMYLDSNPATKAKKGGFAVGGYDMSKSPDEEYLRITRDSTRIYVKKETGKGKKGGFAVGSFDASKGQDTITMFTSLTTDNYFIGENSGAQITTGLFNSFLGYEAGKENTAGMSNVIIGHKAGTSNTIGSSNMFIGKSSGFFNINGERNIFLGDFSGYSNTGGVQTWMGSNNIFIGSSAGSGNTTGGSNIFIGTSAGSANSTSTRNIYIGDMAGFNSTGFRNTFIGSNSGENNTTGDDNIFIGNQTGQNSTTGTDNTIIGSKAGMENGSGSHNVFLGTTSGAHNNSGDYNVFLGSMTGLAQSSNKNVYIGYNAGTLSNADGNIMIGNQAGNSEIKSNRLYIDNSGADKYNALIYGEFDTDLLMMNAVVKIRDLLNLSPRSTAPSNPDEGDIYYDSNYHKLMVWNSTEWMACW